MQDERFDITLHLRSADQRAAQHGQHQADQHIGQGNRPVEDARQQNHRSQVHQRRGDQKGKGHPQRQAGAGEADKQRDRRAGAERRDGAQQGAAKPGLEAAHAAENAPGALRRKIALHPGNAEDQHRQQDEDLDHVVDEEMQAGTEPAAHVQAENRLPPAGAPARTASPCAAVGRSAI